MGFIADEPIEKAPDMHVPADWRDLVIMSNIGLSYDQKEALIEMMARPPVVDDGDGTSSPLLPMSTTEDCHSIVYVNATIRRDIPLYWRRMKS